MCECVCVYMCNSALAFPFTPLLSLLQLVNCFFLLPISCASCHSSVAGLVAATRGRDVSDGRPKDVRRGDYGSIGRGRLRYQRHGTCVKARMRAFLCGLERDLKET